MDVTGWCMKKKRKKENRQWEHPPRHTNTMTSQFIVVCPLKHIHWPTTKGTEVYCSITQVDILSNVTTWGKYSTVVGNHHLLILTFNESRKIDNMSKLMRSRIPVQTFLWKLSYEHCVIWSHSGTAIWYWYSLCVLSSAIVHVIGFISPINISWGPYMLKWAKNVIMTRLS